jgi:hypothetical protein
VKYFENGINGFVEHLRLPGNLSRRSQLADLMTGNPGIGCSRRRISTAERMVVVRAGNVAGNALEKRIIKRGDSDLPTIALRMCRDSRQFFAMNRKGYRERNRGTRKNDKPTCHDRAS